MNSPLTYSTYSQRKEADKKEFELKKVPRDEPPSETETHLKIAEETIEPREGLSEPKDGKIKKSLLFWNAMLLLPLGILAIIDIRLLYLSWMVGSVFAIGLYFDRYRKTPLWIIWMPVTWIILVYSGIDWGIGKVREGIRNFNENLDSM